MAPWFCVTEISSPDEQYGVGPLQSTNVFHYEWQWMSRKTGRAEESQHTCACETRKECFPGHESAGDNGLKSWLCHFWRPDPAHGSYLSHLWRIELEWGTTKWVIKYEETLHNNAKVSFLILISSEGKWSLAGLNNGRACKMPYTGNKDYALHQHDMEAQR